MNYYAPASFPEPPDDELGDSISAALAKLRASEPTRLPMERASGNEWPIRRSPSGSWPTEGGSAGGSDMAQEYVDSRQVLMDGWWQAPSVPRNVGVRHNGNNRPSPANFKAGSNPNKRDALITAYRDPFWLKMWVFFCLIVGVFGMFVSSFMGI